MFLFLKICSTLQKNFAVFQKIVHRSKNVQHFKIIIRYFWNCPRSKKDTGFENELRFSCKKRMNCVRTSIKVQICRGLCSYSVCLLIFAQNVQWCNGQRARVLIERSRVRISSLLQFFARIFYVNSCSFVGRPKRGTPCVKLLQSAAKCGRQEVPSFPVTFFLAFQARVLDGLVLGLARQHSVIFALVCDGPYIIWRKDSSIKQNIKY